MLCLKLIVIGIILSIVHVFAKPQNWPSSSSSQQGYDLEGKGDQNQGIGGDEDAEMIPSKILEHHQEYNVVRYPTSKWICTKTIVDLNKDPMKNWRLKFGNDPLAAIRAMKKLGSPSSKMFKKLFRYIIGVNSQHVEIKMTRPVTTIRKPLKGSPNMEVQVMCFWTGTPWTTKELPQPIDTSLFIQNRPGVDVFVRRFGGWAISQEKWMEEKQNLMRSLGSRMKEVDMEYYETVGYNSPWTQENRRNEIWLVKRTPTKEVGNFDQNKVPEPTRSSVGYGDEDNLETIPYEIIDSKTNYQIRQYPATKWVCTTNKNVDPSSDVMNGWQQKYDNDPLKAISSSGWKKQASSRMFMKLFKYISGANSMGKEVDMTTPVPVKHTPTGNVFANMEEQQMCFWLGSQWQDKSAPPALHKDAEDIKVIHGKPLKVYVRQFGGFAMSHDDWKSQYDQLKLDLKEVGAKFNDNGEFYHLSYNSPFVLKNRRNEVWIEVNE